MDHNLYYFDTHYQYDNTDQEPSNKIDIQEIEEVDVDGILISLVQNYPHLCNKKLTDFKDRIKKENAWIEIVKILNITGNISLIFYNILLILFVGK